MSTIGAASHIEKLDEINRLRDINAALLMALQEMVKQFVDKNATDAQLLAAHGGIVLHAILDARTAIAKATKP